MKNYINDFGDSIILSLYFNHSLKQKEISKLMDIEVKKVNSVINNYKRMMKKINSQEDKLKTYLPQDFILDDKMNLFPTLLTLIAKFGSFLREDEQSQILFHQFQMTMAKLLGKEWIVKREDIDMEISESYFDNFVFKDTKQIRKANLELKERVTIQDFLM